MLKVLDVAELKTEEVSANGYTLKVSWNRFLTSHVYWRTGNFKDALIEIGLNDSDHVIGNFHLVVAAARYLSSEEVAEFSKQEVTIRRGLPLCEWTWDKPAPLSIDEPLDFRLYIGNDHISLRFGDPFELFELIIAERTQFGLDSDGFIRAIQVFDLLPSELANIKLAFPSS
jgi:hypothetical protein